MKIIRTILTILLLSLSFILGITETSGPAECLANVPDVSNSEKTLNFSPSSPDLIIQDITWSPATPSIGDTVTFTVTIKNQGNGDAGPSHTAFSINSGNPTVVSVEQLGPGSTATKTFTWTAEAGSHVIQAVADSDNEVDESDEANNVGTFALSPSAPDLVIQDITWLPDNPSKGDTIQFTVTIKNRGNSKARSSSSSIYIDGVSRGDTDVQALDPGATVTKTFIWIAKAGVHDVGVVADSKNQVIEGDEANNEKTVIFSTLAPDLTVQTITWSPENPSKDDDVTFTVTVKNEGSGRADYFYVACYIDDALLTSTQVEPLEPGATADKTFVWTAKSGPHNIKAVADSDTWVIESDESNNEKTIIFSTLAPDLTIQTITWSPSSFSVGDDVIFTFIIKNQGSGRADSSHVAYYMEGSTNGFYDVQEINAGATVSKTLTWKAGTGTRTFKVVADSGGNIPESDETNNDKIVEFKPLAPDLIIEDITWSPEAPLAGDTAKFTVTIKNQGSGRAVPSYVAFHADDVFLSSAFVNSIDPGATANQSFTLKVEAGSHSIKAVADSTNQMAEDDETNNNKALSFSPAAPDIIIQDITWSPKNPLAGDIVTFTIPIKNKGNGRAGFSHVAYYMDGSSRGYQDIQEIDAGSTITKTFTWTAEAGSHAFKAVADSNKVIAESDETNNEKALNLPPADLSVSDIIWTPQNPAIGDPVTITITIKNQGSGRAPDYSHAAYYVDNAFLTSVQVEPLDPGATVDKTLNWTAEAGSHDIKVVADSKEVIVESDETNNEKSSVFSPSAPDLIIQAINWSLKNPPKGDDVTLTVTIKNQGSARADYSNIACYIDGIYLTSAPIDPVDPGATITKTFNWTAEKGTHGIKVVADSNEVIVESDETNNEETTTFSTTMPDIIIQKVTWSPENMLVEDVVTFTITVKNQGSGKTAPSRLAYYIDDSLKGYSDIPELDLDATVTKTFTWLAEKGTHDIKIVADSNEVIVESDETNNIENQTLTPKTVAATTRNPSVKPVPSKPQEEEALSRWWWYIFGAGILLSAITVVVLMKSRKDYY